MMNTKLFLLLSLICLCFSCQKNSIKIEGNISNLPDGKLILYEDVFSNKLDSINVKNGKFEMKHIFNDRVPHYLGIDYYADNGNKIMFQFPMNSYFNQNKDKWSSGVFLSDDIIKLNGSLQYSEFGKNSPFPDHIKTATITDFEGGEQSKAMQDTNYDLFTRKSTTQDAEIQNLIKKHPSSFHVLFGILKNRYQFSPIQIENYLKLFDKTVQKAQPYKELQQYVVNSKKIDTRNVLRLKNADHQLSEVIDKNYKKHLIVLWASWCGPCRQEIPILKKIVSENKLNGIELISISIDEKESEWQKALKEENMSWKQFIVSNAESENLKTILKYGSAIPYSVLIDNNMKILTNSTGLYDEAEILEMLNK